MSRLTPLLFLLTIGSITNCKNQHRSLASVCRTLGKEIDSLVSSYYENQEFSGSVLVVNKGETIFDKHFGFTSTNSIQLIDATSVFEITSISKQFATLDST